MKAIDNARLDTHTKQKKKESRPIIALCPGLATLMRKIRSASTLVLRVTCQKIRLHLNGTRGSAQFIMTGSQADNFLWGTGGLHAEPVLIAMVKSEAGNGLLNSQDNGRASANGGFTYSFRGVNGRRNLVG